LPVLDHSEEQRRLAHHEIFRRMVTATNTIYHDAAHLSQVILPRVK
jgi:hypothetical protein